MDADLQSLVDIGKITSKTAKQIERLSPQTFVFHKSWGFGQVQSWNLLLNQILIDFQAKKAHPMQLSYAAETLQPLPPDHFLVRKATAPEQLRALAGSNPLPLILDVIESSGGKVTQDQLQKALAPEIVPEQEFKKWWEGARKIARKSGLVSVPTKRTEPLVVRDQTISFADELIDSLKTARQLKQQVAVLEQISKNQDSFTPDQIEPLISQAKEIAGRNLRLDPVQVFELLLVIEDLAIRFMQPGDAASPIIAALKAHENKLSDILGQIPAAKQRRLITQIPSAFPDRWPGLLLGLLQNSSYRVVSEVAKVLVDHGKTEDLRQLLNRTVKEHSASSDVLYWLAKERGAHHFADLLSPDLLTAMLSALERDQFSEARRGSKVHDLLIDDRELIGDLMVDAPAGHSRDLMRRIMVTPAFEELNKRSLMARMIKLDPDLQSMLTGDSDQKEEALIVSWASLEKKKAEYDDLVSKKIPENTREIGIARSYGDLRENFEFKAAKEMQTVLMRRKAELEQMLARARGSNFDNVDDSQVSIGTVVKLRHRKNGTVQVYSILGAWDSNPEQHIVSYQTAIGQALIGKRLGDLVDLPTETGSQEVEVISISSYPVSTNESLQAAGH
jgi:transcription elongation GreA/GreB family factor